MLRICRSAPDARALRLGVLDEIRTVVPFDAYAWLLTDPETSVGSAPLADGPCLSELPRLIRLKYLTEVNRWTRIGSSVALLDEATGGDLSQSLVWRELLHLHGVRDVASAVFADRYGCWGFLDAWRSAHAPFTPVEAGYLTSLVAPVTAGLRRCQAETFVAAERPAQGRGPVVLILSPTLDVLAQTPQTHEYLRRLVPPDEDRSPVPASAYNVAAQLLAVEAGADTNPSRARVHLSGGRWLTVRAARIEDARPLHDRNIAVTIEDSSPTERVTLFARAHGLSQREGELLGHLVAGSDTKALTQSMFLSPHTVQDHLGSIFTKTDVRNRRTLLARALGA